MSVLDRKITAIGGFIVFLAIAAAMFLSGTKTATAAADENFAPRWSIIVDNYNGYFKLKNEELATIYQDIDTLNKVYDQQGEGVFDIAFFPDLRAKKFYEITPYSDSRGQPIADDDTVKKTIMEVRYLLNGNSMIKFAGDSPINMLLNLLPKQDTNLIFARTSDTPFFRKTSNLCLISYDPRLDDMWHARKEFFKTSKQFASEAEMYHVPDEAWRSFTTHLRAGLCVEKNIASWAIEPQGLVMNPEKTERKNRAFSFALVYAALAAKREGYDMLLPKFIDIFKGIEEESGVPVFTMKLMVADLHTRGGSVRVDSRIAYPFTPLEILEKAVDIDVSAYDNMHDLAEDVFRLVIDTKLDTNFINSRWMTEEFKSYRMGL